MHSLGSTQSTARVGGNRATADSSSPAALAAPQPPSTTPLPAPRDVESKRKHQLGKLETSITRARNNCDMVNFTQAMSMLRVYQNAEDSAARDASDRAGDADLERVKKALVDLMDQAARVIGPLAANCRDLDALQPIFDALGVFAQPASRLIFRTPTLLGEGGALQVITLALTAALDAHALALADPQSVLSLVNCLNRFDKAGIPIPLALTTCFVREFLHRAADPAFSANLDLKHYDKCFVQLDFATRLRGFEAATANGRLIAPALRGLWDSDRPGKLTGIDVTRTSALERLVAVKNLADALASIIAGGYAAAAEVAGAVDANELARLLQPKTPKWLAGVHGDAKEKVAALKRLLPRTAPAAVSQLTPAATATAITTTTTTTVTTTTSTIADSSAEESELISLHDDDGLDALDAAPDDAGDEPEMGVNAGAATQAGAVARQHAAKPRTWLSALMELDLRDKSAVRQLHRTVNAQKSDRDSMLILGGLFFDTPDQRLVALAGVLRGASTLPELQRELAPAASSRKPVRLRFLTPRESAEQDAKLAQLRSARTRERAAAAGRVAAVSAAALSIGAGAGYLAAVSIREFLLRRSAGRNQFLNAGEREADRAEIHRLLETHPPDTPQFERATAWQAYFDSMGTDNVFLGRDVIIDAVNSDMDTAAAAARVLMAAALLVLIVKSIQRWYRS